MRKACFGPLCAVLLALACAALAQVTAEERAQGFVPLFNGRDLSGWVVQGGKNCWSVQNGAIVCSGERGGWLRTEKQYADFIWRLEYKISKRGNSGIFIRAPKEGRSSMKGFEIQILDDYGKPPTKYSSGSLYRLVAPTKNMSKPAGQWNTVEITCRGRHITVVWNGEKTIDVDIDDPELNASAPANNKPSRRASKGYLGLQNHRSHVEFRNLRIKEL